MKVGCIGFFDSMHLLPGHPKCGVPHGHTWKVEVVAEGPVVRGMVMDFADLNADAQLTDRGHFSALDHPVLGVCVYERNGFRLSAAASGYPHATPTLGQHTDSVLTELLGLAAEEVKALREAGALD